MQKFYIIASLLVTFMLVNVHSAWCANAKVKLVVKKNSYHVEETVRDPVEIIGGSYPNPPWLITGCGNPPGSEDSWCTVRQFGLASVHCEIQTGLDSEITHPLQLVIDSYSTGDHASRYHEVDNFGCISKIRCAYAIGNDSIGELPGVITVGLARGSWCINSTSEIYCQSTRSGCDSDGPACNYKLSCSHRNSN